MAKHKWAKEIKAWADGEIIESRSIIEMDFWDADTNPYWDCCDLEFRIKPQTKEPRYAYAWLVKDEERIVFYFDKPEGVLNDDYHLYIGKIKLEVDDE